MVEHGSNRRGATGPSNVLDKIDRQSRTNHTNDQADSRKSPAPGGVDELRWVNSLRRALLRKTQKGTTDQGFPQNKDYRSMICALLLQTILSNKASFETVEPAHITTARRPPRGARRASPPHSRLHPHRPSRAAKTRPLTKRRLQLQPRSRSRPRLAASHYNLI